MKRFVLLSLLILPAMATTSWAAESPAGWVATPGDDWRTVDLSQTAVAPGSVLDMSRFIELAAGKYGRIVLDAQGHLVFEKNPSQRAIFFGCSISPEGLLGRTYTTHEEIRRWAGMVRRQGYNLVRPHFLDHYLTRNSSSDLEFDPEALDRFDYLVACLKELLSMPSRQFQVIAPRMEGACLDPEATPGRLVLKQSSIESTSVPASITLVAVDDRPLDQSRRMLLVYATDALNSGMAFTSPQREELVGLGKLPVLMRTGNLKLTIRNPHAAAINAWALGLDGRRVEPIGVTRQGDALTLSIDGRRLKSATPFFELAADR